MGDDLNISTLNVNGLADPKKRRDVFCYLREQKHDIYFLQETHIEKISKTVSGLFGAMNYGLQEIVQTETGLRYYSIQLSNIKFTT